MLEKKKKKLPNDFVFTVVQVKVAVDGKLLLFLSCCPEADWAVRSLLTSAGVKQSERLESEAQFISPSIVALASRWSTGVKIRASPSVNTSRLKIFRVGKDGQRDRRTAPLQREGWDTKTAAAQVSLSKTR